MKSTRYIIVLGLVGMFAFAACSKDDEAIEPDATTRCAASDSTEKDSTSGGGGFKLNTEWEDSTIVNF